MKLAGWEKIDFPLLSDPGVVVAAAYGVAMKGDDLAVPATFVLRPDGTIAYRYVGEDMTDRPSTNEILEKARLLVPPRTGQPPLPLGAPGV